MYTYYDDHIDLNNVNFNMTYSSHDKSCRYSKKSCYVYTVLFIPFIFIMFLLVIFSKKKTNITNFDHFFKEKIPNDNISRSCIICLEKISYNDLIFTKCNHYYHEFCIKKWLNINQICPICKTQYVVDV